MSPTEWYAQFYAMKEALFDGPPDDVERARAFYEDLVGDPAIVRLTVALRLDVTDGGQDWPIEVADPNRVAEFLDVYEQGALDEVERYHLMELIVASVEEHLQHRGRGGPLVARFRRRFTDAHRDTATYWACPDDPRFAITPLMRQILEEHPAPRGS